MKKYIKEVYEAEVIGFYDDNASVKLKVKGFDSKGKDQVLIIGSLKKRFNKLFVTSELVKKTFTIGDKIKVKNIYLTKNLRDNENDIKYYPFGLLRSEYTQNEMYKKKYELEMEKRRELQRLLESNNI